MSRQSFETQLQSRKPKNTPFFQQKLPAWQPMFTAKKSGIIFLIFGFTFIPIGIPLLISSSNLKEYYVDYTDCTNSEHIKCSSVPVGTSCECLMNVHVTSNIDGPVFFYYALKNFYQNHRRYGRSRSDSQLLGQPMSPDSLTSCEPYASVMIGAVARAILPCGAIANSIFNDTFSVTYNNGNNVPVAISKRGIAWQSDVTRKYGTLSQEALQNTVKPPNWKYDIKNRSSNPFVSDEPLMVWMRIAALPNFRKLYGIFSSNGMFRDGLPAGNYTIKIDYSFPVVSFNGRKGFVIADTNWLGGKNKTLGVTFLITGFLHLLLGVAFLVVHFIFAAPKIRNNAPILS